jgi:uncharacterized membrane protein YdjX (TVP38/TMEM64 family)
MAGKFKQIFRVFLVSAIFVALIGFYFTDIPQIFNLDKFQDFIQEYSNIYLSLFLFLGCIIFTILSLPTWYFIVACGYLWGIMYGILIAHLILFISISVTFYLYRRNFRTDRIRKLENNKWIAKINNGLKQEEFFTILITRAVYIIPYNLQNFVYAISSIDTKKYILGSFIGSIPVTIINVSAGYFFTKETPFEKSRIIVIDILIIIIIIIAHCIYKRKIKI